TSAVFHPTRELVLTSSIPGSARLWHFFPTIEAILVEAERDLRVVLSQGECFQYFVEFDPEFCEKWDE
ncbi:MAG: hypothetical protein KC441_14260, partial [Anaerolineales bacterium]|nr:hypothetical protein [Anaerolineales bacterium]